jgi:hypothetical protein
MAKSIVLEDQARQRLFEAAGIISAVRAALSNGLDEDAADNALRAAERLVDDVAGELEGG